MGQVNLSPVRAADPTRQPLTFDRLLKNARDAVAWTRHEFPDAPIAVLGSSQGGVVAMALAAAAGEHLDIVMAHNILDPSLATGFMATLFSADLSGMRNGSIDCPVLVVAGRGDPLFPLSYTRGVYESIVAPHKEMLILESKVHLLFNEDLGVVLPPLLDRLALLNTRPPDTVQPIGPHSDLRATC